MAFSACLEAGDDLPTHMVLALMDSAEKLAAFAAVCILCYLFELAECVGLSQLHEFVQTSTALH